MPSLADLANYGIPIGASVAAGINNDRTAGKNVNTLVGGTDKATATITQNNDDVQALLKKIYGDAKSGFDPYSAAGAPAVKSLEDANAPGGSQSTGFKYDMGEFLKDPSVQWRIDNGNKLMARKQASAGSLNSGGGIKAEADYNAALVNNEYSQDYARQQETFNTNKDEALKGLLAQIGIGEYGTTGTTQAGKDYGSQSVASSNLTAEQVAQLQQEAASATAAGDTAKANAINGIITNVSKGISDVMDVKKVIGTAAKAGLPAVGAAALPGFVGGGTALAGTAAAGTAAAGSTGAAVGLAPAIPGMSLGGSLAGASTPGAAGAAGGSSFMSSASSFLTNPVTAGVAAAIIGTIALLKSQAHWEANDWVKNFQNPFDANMSKLNTQFFDLANSGQLTAGQATQIRNAVAEAAQGYQQKLQEFGSRGSDKQKVATQAQATADKYYGPGFSKVLTAMDATIAKSGGA